MFDERTHRGLSLNSASGPSAAPSPKTSTVWAFKNSERKLAGVVSGVVELNLRQSNDDGQVFNLKIVNGKESLPDKTILMTKSGGVYQRHSNDLNQGSEWKEIGRIPPEVMNGITGGSYAQNPEVQQHLGSILRSFTNAELGASNGAIGFLGVTTCAKTASTKLTMDSHTSMEMKLTGMSMRDHGAPVSFVSSLSMEAEKKGSGVHIHMTIGKSSFDYTAQIDRYGRITLKDTNHPSAPSLAIVMDPTEMKIDSSGRVHLDQCSEQFKSDFVTALCKKGLWAKGVDASHVFLMTDKTEASSISTTRDADATFQKARHGDLLLHTLKLRNNRLGSVTEFVAGDVKAQTNNLPEDTADQRQFKQEKTAERDQLEKDLRALIRIKQTGQVPTDPAEYKRLHALARKVNAGEVLIHGIVDE